jgi:cystathionine beta-lyase
LFSFILKEQPTFNSLSAMLDNLELFGMGYSWGGYESLIIPISPKKIRTATKWNHAGQGLRIHIGLEHPDDLIRDLEKAFSRLA